MDKRINFSGPFSHHFWWVPRPQLAMKTDFDQADEPGLRGNSGIT
jgi:hypothetical protein